MNRRDAVNSAEFSARRARVEIVWRDEVRIDPDSTQGKPAINCIHILASKANIDKLLDCQRELEEKGFLEATGHLFLIVARKHRLID